MLRRLLLATALGTLLVVFAANCDEEEGGSEPGVTLAINPTGIAADGESMAEVTISVTNYAGTVVLTTNRGTFTDSNSATLGIDVSGSAKTLIKSCREGFVEDCVGTASVKATADTALGFASIRFLSTGAGGAGGGGPACEYESSCDNGNDEDLDGHVDCEDDDCCGNPTCPVPIEGEPTPCDTYEADCTDGQDNDSDDRTDCEDSNCCADPACDTGSGGAGGGGGSGGTGPGNCQSLDSKRIYMLGNMDPSGANLGFAPVANPGDTCVPLGEQPLTDFHVKGDGSLLYQIAGWLAVPPDESSIRTFAPKMYGGPVGGDWAYPLYDDNLHTRLTTTGCTPGEPTRLFLGPAEEVIYQCDQEIVYWQVSPEQQLDTLGKELVAVGDGVLLTRNPGIEQYYLLTGDWYDGSARETQLLLPVGVSAGAELVAVRAFGPGRFWLVFAAPGDSGAAQLVTFGASATSLGGHYTAYPLTHDRYVDDEGFDYIPNAVLDEESNLWEIAQAGADGPLAVVKRTVGGGVTEVVYEDPPFAGNDHPPEVHLSTIRPVGLFTGSGNGSLGDLGDCWTEPDGSPAVSTVIKVTGTFQDLGAVNYTLWSNPPTLSPSAGDQGVGDTFYARDQAGEPATVVAAALNAHVGPGSVIELGVRYSAANEDYPYINFDMSWSVVHPSCASGDGTGTFIFDRSLPGDTSTTGGSHGAWTFSCPATNIDVHGCFYVPGFSF